MSIVGGAGGGGEMDTMLQLLKLIDNPAAYKAKMEEYSAQVEAYKAAEESGRKQAVKLDKAAKAAATELDLANQTYDKAKAIEDGIAGREAALEAKERDYSERAAKLEADTQKLQGWKAAATREIEQATEVIKQRTQALTKAEQEVAAQRIATGKLHDEITAKLERIKALAA